MNPCILQKTLNYSSLCICLIGYWNRNFCAVEPSYKQCKDATVATNIIIFMIIEYMEKSQRKRMQRDKSWKNVLLHFKFTADGCQFISSFCFVFFIFIFCYMFCVWLDAIIIILPFICMNVSHRLKANKNNKTTKSIPELCTIFFSFFLHKQKKPQNWTHSNDQLHVNANLNAY